jgi:hypothetical protein
MTDGLRQKIRARQQAISAGAAKSAQIDAA